MENSLSMVIVIAVSNPTWMRQPRREDRKDFGARLLSRKTEETLESEVE
jgi:hypothetical protein